MFPIRDDNPTEIAPLVTIAIIGVCVAVWWGLQGAGFDAGALAGSVCELGAIPGEITGRWTGGGGSPCAIGGLNRGSLLTSMFLHGSWMHLIGNMWFLWIFGNNVEDSMGHGRFLLFYLLCGLVASLAHVFSDPSSSVPVVGASGAISAIMGAYLVLYPRAKVRTLLVLLVFITFIEIPAWLYLVYWFLLQVAAWEFQGSQGAGGVAVWAHLGGFIVGFVLILLFKNPKLVNAKRAKVKLSKDEIDHRGWW